MNKLHIVHVSAYFPPHLGGQENAVQSLTTQLAKAGHDVEVLTSTQGGGKKGVSVENKVRVTRLPAKVVGHAPIMPGFWRALHKMIRPHTVIHLHIGQAFTPEMVYVIARLRQRPYIAQLHIDFVPSGPAGILLPLYKRHVLRRVLHNAAIVAVLNKKTQAIVRDTYACQGNIPIINNGIDGEYFAVGRRMKQQPGKLLKLLFVGRLSKQKNVLMLLQTLLESSRMVQLDVIGDGDEMPTVREFVRRHDLTKRVILHGRLPRAEVVKFYATSDALIMPSLYEAQPLVLLEAMAAKIPIIGTNVIGVAEHIGKNGIVTEPTVAGLSQAIEEFYDRFVELPTMIERGYKKALAYSWSSTLQRYERLYESVLGD